MSFLYLVCIVKVCRMLLVSLAVMVSVWYLQYYQTMLITSLVVSLIPPAILSLQVTNKQTSVSVSHP